MEMQGKVIPCHTFEAWENELSKGVQERRLIVVYFTATWCGPCRTMAPVFTELARNIPSVIFLKVDVDELQSVALDWGVEGMPMFMFLKEGRILDTIVGAKKDELQQLLAKHMLQNPKASSLDVTNAYY